jgi:hypothetical protein
MAVDGCTSTFYFFLFCVCTLETYVTLEILKCMSLLHLSLLFLVAPAIQEALFFVLEMKEAYSFTQSGIHFIIM